MRDEHYDLWIGDEAWELDYYLHENPELNGPLTPGSPTSSAGCRCPTAATRGPLTADYNAEMIEQIARYPRLRDRSVFVGDPDDIVPDLFGPGLPGIRDWTSST